MVDMKCEMCGAVWTKDDSYRGTEIKCPDCQGVCKCLSDVQQGANGYECAVCGLSCPEGVAKCPACGGEVVESRRDEGNAPADNENKPVESSFGENFFWGLIFPEPTLLLGIVSLFNRNFKMSREISAGFICGALLRLLVLIVLILLATK